MDTKEIASKLIEYLGGPSNIVTMTNCMTRVRTTVADPQKVDFAQIEALDCVMSVVRGEQIQVVVGPGLCSKIANAANEQLGTTAPSDEADWQDTKAQMSSKKVRGSAVLKQIANIFVPLIPAIIAAGLANGVAGYFTNSLIQKGITEIPTWILFLQTIGSALFGYFAIYVGINAAKEFGATPGLGGIIGAITISPNINEFSKLLGLFDPITPLNSILTTGKGGIIGVIAGVALLAFIEKRLRKIIPDVITTFVTPLISLLIVSAALIFALMPIAGFISDAIIKAFSVLILSDGIVSIIGGFVVAASFLPLVVVGLHHGLIPFYMIQLEQTGSISLFAILCMAGAGQVGAAIAIYLKAKNNPKLCNIIRSSLPVGFLGIGEPLLYGVLVPLGRPFITACIGGGIAGMFATILKVQTIAFGPSGLVAVPLVIPGKMLSYLLCLFIGYVAGFILTYFLGTPKNLNQS